jgi:hypothetical protein
MSEKPIGEYIFNVWNSAAFGENYPTPLAYLFLYSFDQLAIFVGNTGLFNFMMNSSIPLSFIAFYMFSGKLCGNFWFKILAAILYIINPVFITYYNFGGFMWALVFLPLAFSFFIDLLEKHTKKNLAKAATFTSLTMWTFPTFSPTLLLLLFVTALSYLALTRPKSDFLKKKLPSLSLFVFIVFLCNAPYLFAQYNYFLSPQFSSSYNMVTLFKYTYSEATVPNLLRLAGNAGSPQKTLGYNDPTNIANEIGIIIPATALTSIFWIRRFPQKRTRLIAILLSVASILVLALFVRFLIYSDLSWVVQDTSILWTIRNPIKLQIMLAFCLVPLFVFSLENIVVSCMHLFREKRKNFPTAFLGFTLIFLALSQVYVYNSFVFSGYLGLDKTYGDTGFLPDETTSSIVQDSLGWYKEGSYRGIILPFDHNAELHIQFLNPLLYPARLDFDSSPTNAIKNELEADSNVANLFSLLGIKYVYINKAWKDSGFPIIQLNDLNAVVENLRRENTTEESCDAYSKFIIRPALPHLYLSSYAVFYSNIETVKFLNDSVFYSRPVFLEMSNDGNVANTWDKSAPQIFSSYSFEMLFQGKYDLYVAVSGNGETPVYFSLDDAGLSNRTVTVKENSLEHLSRLELKVGVHKLLLAINENSSCAIAGIWLLPQIDGERISSTLIGQTQEYSLQFNQSDNSEVILFLGETYDSGWKAKMDGTVLTDHLRANLYANCWLANATQGVHKIEIYYEPNVAYQWFLYMSIILLGGLLIACCLPSKLLKKFQFMRRRELKMIA